MKLVSDAYREIGKTALNIGQGIILAMLLAFLLKEEVSPWLGLLGIAIGLGCLVVGITFVQMAYYQKKRRKKDNG